MRVCIIILLSFISSVVYAQTQDSIIIWSENRPLSWNDFVFADSDTIDSYENANIWPEIRWSIEVGSSINVTVDVCVVVSKSWTIDTVSNDLLSHEQLHFDIAELYGRKIRKLVQELKQQKKTDSAIYEENINLVLDEYDRRQYLYDKETAHGTSKTIQAEWVKKISAELLYLAKFKSR